MTRGPAYKIQFRRRRMGLTNYRDRRRAISSGLPRLVVRKSNMYIRSQIVESRPGGDLTVCEASSRELKKIGWQLGCANVMASYFTGMLCGLRAKRKGIKEVILDIGLHEHTKGGKVYAAGRGARDAGMNVRMDDSILPADERISGKILESYYSEVLSSGRDSKQFSKYRAQGLEANAIARAFKETKERITDVAG